MLLHTIGARELAVAAKKKNLYWQRSLAGAVAFLIALPFLIFPRIFGGGAVAPASAGQALFGFLTAVAFLFMLAEGLRKAADAIAGERRDGTLELLLLTRVSTRDVVAGKWLSVSLDSLYRLLAIFPVLGLPLLMGGVKAGEFFRASVALASALLFSLSASLFASSLSRKSERAVAASAALVTTALLLGAPQLFSRFPAAAAGNHAAAWMRLALGASWLSPLALLRRMPDLNYHAAPAQFWVSLLFQLLLSAAFLLAAAFGVSHGLGKARALAPRRARVQKKKTEQSAREKLLRDSDPVYWLALRESFQSRGRTFILFLLAMALPPAGALVCRNWLRGPGAVDYSMGIAMLGMVFYSALGIILEIRIAFQAVKIFVEGGREQTLDLLLATPLDPLEIIAGQLKALRSIFLAPLLILGFALWIFPLAVRFTAPAMFNPSFISGGLSQNRAFAVTEMASADLIFIANCLAIAWTGMAVGLGKTKTLPAVAQTIAIVLVIPWFLKMFSLPILAFFFLRPFGSFFSFLVSWTFDLAKDAVCLVWARQKLKRALKLPPPERALLFRQAPPGAPPPVIRSAAPAQ